MYTVCIDVKLTIVAGNEVAWSLGSYQFGPYTLDQSTATETFCVKPGSYSLICKDSAGDGWHGGYIEINDQKYCEEFRSGSSKTSQILISVKGMFRSKFQM